jgi:hypothetical protein
LLRQIFQGIYRLTISSNFKMQLGDTIFFAHCCHLLAGRNRHPFFHQPLLAISVRTQISFAVFDNDQITIIGQTITTIYHLAVGNRDYRLAELAGNIDSASIEARRQESVQGFTRGRPGPFAWVG